MTNTDISNKEEEEGRDPTLPPPDICFALSILPPEQLAKIVYNSSSDLLCSIAKILEKYGMLVRYLEDFIDIELELNGKHLLCNADTPVPVTNIVGSQETTTVCSEKTALPRAYCRDAFLPKETSCI
jgi:hypothetical protein